MNLITKSPSESDLGPATLIITWLFTAFGIIVVTIRFWVRSTIIQRFTIDDWTILITLFLALGNSALITASVHVGLGKHMESLSPDNISNSLKWALFAELFGVMSPCIGRISFALLLLNILPPGVRRRRFLWTIIGCQFVVDVVCVTIAYCQCKPLEKWWKPQVDGTCWPQEVQEYIGFFQGSICSLTDLLLAVFPASLFWNLRMEWKVKLSLSILMGLGIVAMIASIIKTVSLRLLTQGAGDPTYNFATFVIWWTIEGYLVLIAACIPTLKPIFRRTGTSTNASSGPTNISKTWGSTQPHSRTRNLTNGMNSFDERPFFELGNTTPVGVDDLHDRERYKYRAHTHYIADHEGEDLPIQMPNPVVERTIRKDTTTEVIYEDAVSLNMGVVGKW